MAAALLAAPWLQSSAARLSISAAPWSQSSTTRVEVAKARVHSCDITFLSCGLVDVV